MDSYYKDKIIDEVKNNAKEYAKSLRNKENQLYGEYSQKVDHLLTNLDEYEDHINNLNKFVDSLIFNLESILREKDKEKTRIYNECVEKYKIY